MTALAIPAMDFSRAPASPDEMSGIWAVAQVLSRHERRVATDIDVGWYLPTYRETRQYASGRKAWEAPLFPGYLFVCYGDEGDLYALRSHSSVFGIIPINDQRRFVRELSTVHLAVERGEIQPYRVPVVGQDCRVISGPYRGAKGKVIRTSNRMLFVLGVGEMGAAELHVAPGKLEILDDPENTG